VAFLSVSREYQDNTFKQVTTASTQFIGARHISYSATQDWTPMYDYFHQLVKQTVLSSSEISRHFSANYWYSRGGGIANGYGLECRDIRVRVPVGSRISSTSFGPTLRVHPNSYPLGTGTLFPRVKRSGREADRSTPTNAEVKKMWIYTFTPIRLHGLVLN
jgi:hypothetical protein